MRYEDQFILDQLREINKTLQQFLTLYAQRNQQSTDVVDCGRCQCNFCENLETCKAGMKVNPDEIRPAACFGCDRGKRHMPIESACCPNFKPGGTQHVPLRLPGT